MRTATTTTTLWTELPAIIAHDADQVTRGDAARQAALDVAVRAAS